MFPPGDDHMYKSNQIGGVRANMLPLLGEEQAVTCATIATASSVEFTTMVVGDGLVGLDERAPNCFAPWVMSSYG
jgi:hypothetical protein